MIWCDNPEPCDTSLPPGDGAILYTESRPDLVFCKIYSKVSCNAKQNNDMHYKLACKPEREQKSYLFTMVRTHPKDALQFWAPILKKEIAEFNKPVARVIRLPQAPRPTQATPPAKDPSRIGWGMFGGLVFPLHGGVVD